MIKHAMLVAMPTKTVKSADFLPPFQTITEGLGEITLDTS